MRYLSPWIARDLQSKVVLLSGPRQVGKSTLAKGFLGERGVYLNWDIRADQRFIREMAWPKDASMVVLDELHKLPKWKNYLKGLVDNDTERRPPVLVTGSARLETFRKAGDALTGRTYAYHLHPIDVTESASFLPGDNVDARLTRLVATGGFPEAFLNPHDAERLLNDRLDFVLREDLRDLSRTNAIQSMGTLIELLRERVGGQAVYSNLAEDLSVSGPTVKTWIDLLESLYLVFRVPPYSRSLARSIRKEPKIYFYDCAAAYAETGARLENVVACALLKFCQFEQDVTGKKMALHYFRDRQGREVDFVVTERQRVKWCIEVKESDDSLHTPLAYLAERLKPELAIQLVRRLGRAKHIRGVRLEPLGPWLEKLNSRPSDKS